MRTTDGIDDIGCASENDYLCELRREHDQIAAHDLRLQQCGADQHRGLLANARRGRVDRVAVHHDDAQRDTRVCTCGRNVAQSRPAYLTRAGRETLQR